MRAAATLAPVVLLDGVAGALIKVIGVKVEAAAGVVGVGGEVEAHHPRRSGVGECRAERVVRIMPLRVSYVHLPLPTRLGALRPAGDDQHGGAADVILRRGAVHHFSRLHLLGGDRPEDGSECVAGDGHLATIDEDGEARRTGQRDGAVLLAHAGQAEQRLVSIRHHSAGDESGHIVDDPPAGEPRNGALAPHDDFGHGPRAFF